MKITHKILKEIGLIILIYSVYQGISYWLGLDWHFWDFPSWNLATFGFIAFSIYLIYCVIFRNWGKIYLMLYKFRNFLLILYYAVTVSYWIRKIFIDYVHTDLYRLGSIFLVALIVGGSIVVYQKLSSGKEQM